MGGKYNFALLKLKISSFICLGFFFFHFCFFLVKEMTDIKLRRKKKNKLVAKTIENARDLLCSFHNYPSLSLVILAHSLSRK